MAKKQGAVSVQGIERLAGELAREMKLELWEVTLQKESRGKCLCVYLDKEGGLTLDDCERYHKRIQPLLKDVDYDFLEVSSPGIDRPITTQRDFEKNRDQMVEVRLFRPMEGGKSHIGQLREMDENHVSILTETGNELVFPRTAVAVVRPVVDLSGLIDDEA